MKNVRAHVVVDGRVQGVCFRLDTRRAASERKVKGWVRNLPDGRVEAVLEGDEEDVKSNVKIPVPLLCPIRSGQPFKSAESVLSSLATSLDIASIFVKTLIISNELSLLATKSKPID